MFRLRRLRKRRTLLGRLVLVLAALEGEMGEAGGWGEPDGEWDGIVYIPEDVLVVVGVGWMRGKMGGRSRSWSSKGVGGKAPGMRSDGVVGCEERGLVLRSAGEWRCGSGAAAKRGGDGEGGGGGMSVPAVREMVRGGREGSWNLEGGESDVGGESRVVEFRGMVMVGYPQLIRGETMELY